MDIQNGPIYCSEQIKIPPELPDILKQFTKAAIRTQPNDLLEWSLAYFKALASDEVPPVKQRLEMPTSSSKKGGLTKGALSMLHTQLGAKEKVAISELEEKWKAAGFNRQQLDDLIELGNFKDEVDWLSFLSLACSALENNITAAMTRVCEMLSPDPDGGAARIPLTLLMTLYRFLAQIDGEISKERTEAVENYLKNESVRYDGHIGPAEFTHSDCPKLDGE
jgi:hypothetical protein